MPGSKAPWTPDALLAPLPEPAPVQDPSDARAQWTRWQEGLRVKITLPAVLPPLRLLLVWDNLTGHHTPELVLWLFARARGVMVLYTPHTTLRLLAHYGRGDPAHLGTPGFGGAAS